ncbi:MAG: sigma-70 family RNA polymerase sigma factor [Cyclobacteriaceae bacterium]
MGLKAFEDSADFEQQQIWAKFRSGDRNAFERIYKSYFPELYRYGMAIAMNEAVVKDSIQQLFLDLWQYRTNLSDVQKLGSYLLKSLRSKIFKIEKEINKPKKGLTPEKLDLEFLPSHEKILIDAQEREFNENQLKLVVNDLPIRQREVILLIFFENKSYEEVSELMSMNVQSVYTLVWRGISTLRKKLS